jgi:hypothetical protein
VESEYWTEQLPPERVHSDGLKLPPGLVVAKSTTPEGLFPLTVAVHTVVPPSVIDEGEQVTEVEVGSETGVGETTVNSVDPELA